MKKVICFILLGTMISCSTPKFTEYDAFRAYYDAVEYMIDEFCYEDECFMDTFGESDAYSEYWNKRKELEKIAHIEHIPINYDDFK